MVSTIGRSTTHYSSEVVCWHLAGTIQIEMEWPLGHSVLYIEALRYPDVFLNSYVDLYI